MKTRSTLPLPMAFLLLTLAAWAPGCGDATLAPMVTPTPSDGAQTPAAAGQGSADAAPVTSAGGDGVTAVTDAAPNTLGPGANGGLLALRAPIEAAARASGVPASLLGGLIWAESRADVNVAGGGLTQISDYDFQTAQAAHPKEVVGSVADADANIMASAFNLLELRDVMQKKYGRSDWPIILRAYNSGRNGVDPNDLAARPAGTGDPAYVSKVTRFWQIIASGDGTLPP